MGSAGEAMRALSRVLAVALEAGSPPAVHRALTREARSVFGVPAAALLALPADRRPAVLSTEPAGGEGAPATELGEALDLPLGTARVEGSPTAARVGRALGIDFAAGSALLLPMRSRAAADHALVLLHEDPEAFDAATVDVASAFAEAAGAALAQLHVAEAHAVRVAQLSALTRAAKTLNQSLDLQQVLVQLCEEAQAMLDADRAVVYRGSASEGLTVEAATGFPGDVAGYRLAHGEGLTGRVADADRAMLTNDYQRLARPGPESPFHGVQSALAVPMHWDGALRGVLSVGFTRPHAATPADLRLLQSFAELASVACHNASAAAGLERAARTDSLTGCLNHAALQEGLRREMERCARTDQPLSLVLLDLDDFKQVNERHGHLVGDEVLRRVGHALRASVRPYDLVARYGGDEFAIVATDADEAAAAEIADRALARVAGALEDIGDPALVTGATAGIGQWTVDEPPPSLVERADRALLWGKHEGLGGGVVPASAVPDQFRPGRFRREGSWPAPEPSEPGPPSPAQREQTARLQKRTRQLVFANALGARLAAMTDADQILNAAVDEVQRAFGYFLCAIVRVRPDDYVELAAGRGEAFEHLLEQGWSQSRHAGLIGRCLRERRIVLVDDVAAEPDYVPTSQTAATRSELVAPLWVGEELWGAINIEQGEPQAFDEDDARLVQTVADQVGSAMRSALLYERLERAYVGTAEALAAALKAKDAYTAEHAHSIVGWAQAVGARLGMDAGQLSDLHYAAIFHDIGKIAVPEHVLNKAGPLDDDEWDLVKRHTIVGEQILGPVEFLAGVRPLVRHEHERWDGGGYPDGLAGEDIPLGARIILVCDAYHAMTSDRPYRAALTPTDATAELRRCAGTQFDPRVVEAFLAVANAPGTSTLSPPGAVAESG